MVQFYFPLQEKPTSYVARLAIARESSVAASLLVGDFLHASHSFNPQRQDDWECNPILIPSDGDYPVQPDGVSTWATSSLQACIILLKFFFTL